MLSESLSKIWESRRLMLRLIAVDLKTTYSGTAIGLLWIVLGPVILLFLYSMIYAVIFRVRVPNFTVEEYILNVFAGLVPFLAFAGALSASSNALLKDKGILFNRQLASECIPIKAVMVSYVILFVGIFITFIGDAIFSEVTWTWVFVPVVVALQLLTSIGIGFFLSLVNLVFKDVQFLIQYIVIALLVITPIAYTPDMIPTKMLTLLYANPLFYYIYSYQHLILLNEIPPIQVIGPAFVLAFSFFFAGLWFYGRLQRSLIDLI